MSRWELAKLVDIAHISNGYAFRSGEYQEFQSGYLEVLKMGHIQPGGGLRLSPKKSFMPRDKRYEKHILNKGDIVLAMTDMKDNMCILGHPAIIDLNNHYVLNQRVGRVVVKQSNRVDPQFLYYQMRSPEFISELQAHANSGVQVNLTTSSIRDSEIRLPTLAEQRAIAAVLSSLDDKIDLLHRQNKTLESLASALWRKIFIEDADLKWKRGVLGDMVELCYGKALKEEQRSSGKYPVVGSSGVVGAHNEFLVKGPGIVIGRKGTLGLVNYIAKNFWPIDTTFFIKSKSNSEKLYFEYFLLKEFAFEDMNSDSAVPGLNRDIAMAMEFAVPAANDIDGFNQATDAFFEKKLQNQLQINNLVHIRDELLPKLISGELKA